MDFDLFTPDRFPWLPRRKYGLLCFNGEGGASSGSAGAAAGGAPAAGSGSGTGSDPTPPDGQSGKTGGDGKPVETPPEPTIPKSRFDEVNKELRTLKQQQEQAERDRQAREEEEARKKGEFEKLANEKGARVSVLEGENTTLKTNLENATKELEELRGIIKGQLDDQIAKLPKELQDLFVNRDDLKASQALLAKLAPVAARLGAGGGTGSTDAANGGGGTGSGGSNGTGNKPGPKPTGAGTPDEQAKLRQREMAVYTRQNF